MYPENLYALTESLLKACEEKSLRIAVAESCTGGLIGGLITAIPGSSTVFDRGYIVYTNQAKGEELDVPAHIFMLHGAVSKECACALAEGALKLPTANLTVSATGIAGPDGALENKPLGLVHIAVAREGHTTLHECHVFNGDRGAVRMQAVEHAVRLLVKMVAD